MRRDFWGNPESGWRSAKRSCAWHWAAPYGQPTDEKVKPPSEIQHGAPQGVCGGMKVKLFGLHMITWSTLLLGTAIQRQVGRGVRRMEPRVRRSVGNDRRALGPGMGLERTARKQGIEREGRVCVDEPCSPRWSPETPGGWLVLYASQPLGQNQFHYFQHHGLPCRWGSRAMIVGRIV